MKVLLVEDDAMIGENIQIALHGEGMTTDWVKDGMAAESMLTTHTYDALLLDLGIPRKDGTDVLSDLRKSGSNLPVLIITARDTIAQRVQGLNLGADDYLVKPFDLEELIARLHALVRRARGNADRNAFQTSDFAGGIEGGFIGDGDDLVDHTAIQDRRNETRADALNFVWSRLAAREHW